MFLSRMYRRWQESSLASTKSATLGRRLQLEPLEDRRLLALIGFTPTYPLISYDSNGTVNYDAAAQTLSFTLDATPLQFRQSAISPIRTIAAPRDFLLQFQVNNQGQLLGGAPGNDLYVSGTLDIDGNGTIDYSGTLLTGEITQFGAYDSGTTSDKFDFRFVPTGGPLASLYAGKDIGVTTTSESSTFAGAFNSSFTGYAKGNIGSVSALWSSLSGSVYNDGVDNDGIKQAGDAGIAGVSVTLTGTDIGGNPVSISKITDSNGAYSFTQLRPGVYTVAETQPTGWVDGKDSQGTPGTGAANNDLFTGIVLAAGVNGVNNNFGELPLLPGIQLVKLTNGAHDPNLPAGSSVTWSYDVTNTGNTSLSNVTVSDDDPGAVPVYQSGDTNSDGLLSVGETWLFTASGIAAPGQYANTGTATGTASDATGTVHTNVSATDVDQYFGVSPQIELVKLTNGTNGPNLATGSDVAWSYIVTNAGNVPLANITISDDQGVVPQYQDGDTNADGRLDLDEKWLFTATGTAVAGAYVNTATVTGDDVTGAVVAPQTATATDGYFGVEPGIAVDKLTNGTHNPNVPAGSTLTWTYSVTNAGNVPLAGVSLNDDAGVVPQYQSGDSNADGNLDLNETWLYTATTTAIAASYNDDGTVVVAYSNTATARGTDATGTVAGPEIATATDGYFGVAPGIAVDKLTNGTHDPNVAAGSIVTWTYSVTNTGNVPLTAVALSDDQGVTPQYQDGDTNADGRLDLDEKWLFTATGTAIVGAYANTATVSGSDVTGTITPAQIATATDGYFGVAPAIDVDKLTNGTHDPNVAAGSIVTWTYTVTNTGNVPLASVSIDDDQGVVPQYQSGDANANGQLDVGEAWIYSATDTAIAASYSQDGTVVAAYSNTATVRGTDATGTIAGPQIDTATDGYFGVAPGIAVDKLTNGTHNPNVPAGANVTWTYVVTNTGNVPLASVSIDDDQGVVPQYQSGDTNGDGKLDLGETWLYAATGTAIVGAYGNTATVSGTDATGTVIASQTATATDGYFGVAPGIAVDKLTNGTHNPNVPAGANVTWTYVVSNTGNVPLANVALSDDQGVVPQYQSGDVNGNGNLDLGEAWLYTASSTAVVGNYVNTVTASGADATGTVASPQVATASDGYFGVQTGIQLVKKTNGTDNANANLAAGTTVTWTYVVTNAGNVALSGVTVTDSDPTVRPTYASGDANSDGTLNVGEVWTYTASGVAIVGPYSNTATVSGADATGTVATPVVASEGDGYFGVQPGIQIIKTTNGTDNNSAPGLQVTAGSAVTWTYTVENTGNVALGGVTVADSDSTVHPAYANGDANSNGRLDIGETWTYTASGVAVVGTYSGTGTVIGTDGTGTVATAVSASDVDYYSATAPTAVNHGDFATIGFWHNKNGQALIKSLNGSANSTALAQWLATNFPNLYGRNAGVYSMVNSTGAYFTNTQVATAYNTYFFTTGSGAKTNAQVMAAALGVYATSTTLAGGAYAKKYGFNVSAAGAGSDAVTLGCDAAAFGNNTRLTVLDMLKSVNAQASGGVLYATSSQKSALTTQANHAFDTQINSAGDIAMMVLGSQPDGTFDATLTSDALHLSTLLIYVDNTAGNMTPEEAARIGDAVGNLNAQLGSMGMCLIAVPDELGLMADITISMADTTVIGGVAEGVLGLTEMGGTITLVGGWNWYTGDDPTLVGAGQFDFETVATHELGHGIGLGHSADRASVMFPYLSTGEVRHDLTANDIAIIGQYAPGELAAMAAAMLTGPEALMASPGLSGLPEQPAPALSPVGCDQVFGRGAESTSDSTVANAPSAKLAPATHESALRSVMADWSTSALQAPTDWLALHTSKRGGNQESHPQADGELQVALTGLQSEFTRQW